MALIDFKVLPGIDKQDTESGAENRWVDCDNTRFRYGLPEKVGGWSSLVTDTIVSVARKEFAFVDLEGNRYVAIGTDKFLLIYFEGQLYDVTPVKSTISSVVMSAQDATKEVSLTFSSAHNLQSGDIILLDNVTVPSGIGLTDAAFEDKLFQVTKVTSSLIAIVTGTQTTTGAAGGGACSVIPYEPVGPAAQSYGYGWGISEWDGIVSGALQNTLNGTLADNTSGTSGSNIALTSATGFPTAGRVQIGTELISYTGISTNNLTGITRAVDGSTRAAHSSGATVTNAADFVDWGEASSASEVSLEPGLWSLSNFGQVLVATIANGKTFTWNAGDAARLTTRASTTTSGFSTSANPTATRVTLVSPTTRHLIHLGTETTIGNTATQDNMFIRFSDQENINDYTPTAINSAGSQRLQDGTKIIGALKAKESILVWTDNALYTMKFIGSPFTFGFEQVGTNCGLIGKNAAVEIDGAAFWMSPNGFFMFDGTVKSLPCSVEDYVYDQADTTKGQQICAGLNNQFTEVVWYYPSTNSAYNDQYVVFNYGEAMKGGVWYIGTEARTSWIDSTVYPKPFATKFNASASGSFPEIIGEDGLGQTTLFEHEIGTDQVNADGSTTTVTSFVKSYDFDIQSRQQNAQGKSTGPSISGEVFLAMRRFVPDFKDLQGNAKVTLAVKRYPQQSDTTTSLSPFTINSSTDKKDTRARGRFVNIKIENTDVSESWRFGTLKIDIQPDGRR
jgi:hypothetical protein|tara:strand:- start:809 stop:3007 length:2199 start_codon:yes stop_codon:yes gene_type:complete